MSHEALDPEAHKVGHILIEVHVGNDGHLYVNHEVEGDMPLAAALGYMELTKDTMLHPPEDD